VQILDENLALAPDIAERHEAVLEEGASTREMKKTCASRIKREKLDR
jgi:hypothetical protein